MIRAINFGTTADGPTVKMLNVVDEFTREALTIHGDRAIGVVDVLDRLTLQHGAPHSVRFDGGPEFVGPHFAHHGITSAEFAQSSEHFGIAA